MSLRDVDLDRLKAGQVLKVPVVLGLDHFKTQQQQQLTASSGWFGLGRILSQPPHSQNGSTGGSSSSSNSSSSSSREVSRQALTAEDEHAGPSSSDDNSSSDDWFEPGSSLLAGSSSVGSSSSSEQQPRLQPHKQQHLLKLATGGRGNSSSNGFSAGLFSGVLGTSDCETEDSGSHRLGTSSSSSSSSSGIGQLPGVNSPAAAAVAHAAASGHVPGGGLVAVKVQYPGALQTMTLDLVNLRSVSAFLQKTELRFDLVSAVDELQRQIHLEFDFMRYACVSV